MGTANVQLLLLRWSPYLHDVPFRVAVQMALSSLDEDDPPRYWAGWAPLARAAGKAFDEACEKPRADGSTCRGCPRCAAARKTVDRAVTALRRAGLVEQVEAARLRRNAAFALRLDAPRPAERVTRAAGADKLKPFRRSADDGGCTTLSDQQTQVAQRPADAGRSASELHDAQRPAEEKRSQPQEYSHEDGSPTDSTSPRARDDEQQCRSCKWLPRYGHAPGCAAAVPA